MRNLSKVLALVLSLAFVLTMLSGAVYVPAADADYSDFEELSDAGKVAVNTLDALGIVNGMPDNTFEGSRDVKRSEYAKMIDTAKTGKTADGDFDAYANDKLDVLFRDVDPAAWYSGYVNYAFLNYILAGYGNGLMKPNASVTGLEAAKMTLVALGYNPKIEGLEGIEWKKNTLRIANDIGLLDNLDKEVIEAAFDREATVILIYNALKAQTISSYDANNNPIKGETLAQKVFGGIGKEYLDEPDGKNIADDAEYFLDGEKITADELADKAHYFERAIDNDGDNLVEKLYYISYNGKYVQGYEDGIYEVTKVDGNTLTLAGFGDVEVVDASAIAVGDWVKLTKTPNAEPLTANKLTVKTGVIVAYADNSSTERGDNTGLGTTTGGKEYTVKFDDGTTKKFTFKGLGLTDEEAEYWEAIVGIGSAAVQNGIKLNYILDGDKIITFFKGEETYWDGYAIVLETGTATTLGMESVRLYTDDNEVKDFWVASYNGNQIYNNNIAWDSVDNFGSNGLVNKLVKYEEIGNGQVYLYSADYTNANSTYADDLEMTFDPSTGMWEAFKEEQNSVTYAWDNATVFVSYNKRYNDGNEDTAGNQDAPYIEVKVAEGRRWRSTKQWRAYRVGEFQPASANEVNRRAADESEVLYVKGLNNVNIIKAAAITFNHRRDNSVLPGLPLRATEKWGTIMGLTSVTKADGSYNYEVKILLPYSEYKWDNGKLVTTETIKLSNPGALTTYNVGDIYKFFMDEDGIARRFEVAATAESMGQYKHLNSSSSLGSNYLEVFNASNISMIKNGNGYALKIEYPEYKPTSKTFKTQKNTLFITEATDVFFTEGLFTNDIVYGKAVSNVKADLSTIDLRDYHVYADINPTTNEVYAVWFEKNTGANEVLTLEGVSIKTEYDADNEMATYTLTINGINFKNGTNAITVHAKPYELKAPIGDGAVDVEIKQAADGNWYIEDENALSGYTWVSYSGKANVEAGKAQYIAQSDFWAIGDNYSPDHYWSYQLVTPDTGASGNLTKIYDTTDYDATTPTGRPFNTQLVWYREALERTNLLGYERGGQNTPFMSPLGDVQKVLGGVTGTPITAVRVDADSNLLPPDFNPDGDGTDGDAYDYEISYVMTSEAHGNGYVHYDSTKLGTVEDAFMIVLVDLDNTKSTDNTNQEYFPYVLTENAPNP